MDEWALINMNSASFRRVQFENTRVGAPPEGPWVLQVFQDNVQSGSVVGTGPLMEATDSQISVSVIFWMDGSVNFPAQLKIRRRFSFSDLGETPVLNLDGFGNQDNQMWLLYTGTASAIVGQRFSLLVEASLGGDRNNSVAVNKLVVNGAKAIHSNVTTMNFENGLLGWSLGQMQGGMWELKNQSHIDPALKVPKPPSGDMILVASRQHILSGIMTIESPILSAAAKTSKKLYLRFWVRGSSTYPVSLSIRKKSPDGVYDELPFVNLRRYGNVDSQNWLSLDKTIYVPLNDGEMFYQLVIEVDLGSRLENLVAVDDLSITTLTLS
ncbi:uncharacterized protein LOC121876210 [Homarus americanus]|nr:uncharacterized protein LOC121876210 [Homarus americanus]